VSWGRRRGRDGASRPDRDARDSGQFGLALRYMFEPLNTEFGAYFMNYHSRAPIFSGAAGTRPTWQARYRRWGHPLRQPTRPAAAMPLYVAGNSSYFVEYPEDIRLYGLSFSTTLPTGTAWSGEVSYRPNAPVQLNTTDILYSGLTPLDPNASVLNGTAGQDLHGYRRKEITQFQTTFTHFFDQVMGAAA
jgi:hypothetical protein